MFLRTAKISQLKQGRRRNRDPHHHRLSGRQNSIIFLVAFYRKRNVFYNEAAHPM
jgi:hypothetical protein